MNDSIRAMFALPPASTLSWLFPACAVYASLALGLAAWLKRARGWKTGYTRKTFHFLTFAAAAALHASAGGRPWLNTFGGATSCILLYALVRGGAHPAHPWYAALARENDAPHRTWYIVVPYCATLAGGLAASAWAGKGAVLGYLVCGLGDAVGEPVGTRFGRHRYRVPSPGRVVTYRSLEGSAAVLLVSWLALLAGLAALRVPLTVSAALVAGGIALISAATEAVAPHGGDNFFLIVVPAVAGSMWLL